MLPTRTRIVAPNAVFMQPPIGAVLQAPSQLLPYRAMTVPTMPAGAINDDRLINTNLNYANTDIAEITSTGQNTSELAAAPLPNNNTTNNQPSSPFFTRKQAEKQQHALAKEARKIQSKLQQNFFSGQIIATFIALAGEKTIYKESVVVITSDTTKFTKDYTALSNTLYDPLMGPSDVAAQCCTCLQERLREIRNLKLSKQV